MKRLYEKNELVFALVWIAVYCAVSIPIRGSQGDESLAMLIGLAVIAAGIFAFVKRFHLEERYGLVKWSGSAGTYLFFIPPLFLMTGNLWGGAGAAYGGIRTGLKNKPCKWFYRRNVWVYSQSSQTGQR